MPRRKLTEEEKKIRVERKRDRDRSRYQRLKENPESLAQWREKDKERHRVTDYGKKLAEEHIWAELKYDRDFLMFFANRTTKMCGKNLIVKY